VPDVPARASVDRPDAAARGGVLVIDKPAGPTSHDIVAVVRRRLRGAKVGHTGTLDPLATGVLPLVIGRATRLARYLSGADKEYDAVIEFGRATDTCDASGRVVFEAAAGSGPPPAEAVASVLAGFRGAWMQTPPAYSARLAGGIRAYEQARRGETVEREPCKVTVSELDLLSLDGLRLRVRLVASAGFYVRAFAHEMGRQLGCGAYLVTLRRLRSGPFGLSEAVPLGALDDAALEDRVLPLESLLTGWPEVVLTPAGTEWAAHGRDLGPGQCRDGLTAAPAGRPVRLLAPDGRLVGVAAMTPGGVLHPDVILV
jgi:tRNA pseudouridine55 synthase